MEWSEKKVLVVGTGVSGIAATDLLVEVGANVVLFDGNKELVPEEIRGKLKNTKGVEIVLGELPKECIDSLDCVVISPGVPIDNPLVVSLQEAGKKILGEVELAYLLSRKSSSDYRNQWKDNDHSFSRGNPKSTFCI